MGTLPVEYRSRVGGMPLPNRAALGAPLHRSYPPRTAPNPVPGLRFAAFPRWLGGNCRCDGTGRKAPGASRQGAHGRRRKQVGAPKLSLGTMHVVESRRHEKVIQRLRLAGGHGTAQQDRIISPLDLRKQVPSGAIPRRRHTAEWGARLAAGMSLLAEVRPVHLAMPYAAGGSK
jgi:hypothetical protein